MNEMRFDRMSFPREWSFVPRSIKGAIDRTRTIDDDQEIYVGPGCHFTPSPGAERSNTNERRTRNRFGATDRVEPRFDRNGDGVLEDGWFDVAYQPARDFDGKISGVLSISIDVTDQARHQKR